jgi:hypothetical protein
MFNSKSFEMDKQQYIEVLIYLFHVKHVIIKDKEKVENIYQKKKKWSLWRINIEIF